ncbi:MAG TPA: 50S ribosomal protein L5 [Gemmatimonadaceae bacterium]|nr:50S ribosomal protein L5 [Gemmatimonadaceae bacterium]
MATKQKQGARGAQESSAAASGQQHAGLDTPAPPPRLREYYERAIRPKLQAQFGFTNVHEIPKLTKIVINVGVGEAVKQPKILDSVVEEIGTIAGQKPIRTRAKKSISNFGLRQGQEIGASVTLRGARMWEFLDRFISVAIPRIRDFRGVSTRSFDGRGNYSLGLKEQVIFPEINYDRVEQLHGMDITFVTNAGRDDQALALLRELGMPFRGDEKPVIVRL